MLSCRRSLPPASIRELDFLQVDMTAAVTSAQATYLTPHTSASRGCVLDTGQRRKAHCQPTPRCAVTTDAVQVFGGVGYTRNYQVDMREAEIMPIFEGTNQIQRLVIARALTR